jgi:gas vesicle protein
MTGPQIIGLGIGAAAVAAVGLALRAFPTDVLRELSVLMATAFEGVGKTIERVFTGISNIINKITEMRTSVISATTEQIKQLAGVPANNMFAAAKGIQAIKDALDGFAPGIFAGISQSIGGLFAPDKIGPLDKMASLGPQLQNSAVGFTAFKAALTGMNLANLSMTSDQIDSFERLTARLPKFTESITAIGAQSANINAATTAIQSFKQAANGFDINQFVFNKEQLHSLADGTTKLKALAEQLRASKDGFQKLDTQGLKNIKEGVEGLSKAFKDFNDSFINKFLPKFEETRNKTQEGIMSELGNKLDTLNSSVRSLITIEDASKKNLDTIANKSPGAIIRGRQ